LYAAAINSGTGTHGYTATGSESKAVISIFAPVNTGTIANGSTIATIIATNGVAIRTNPTPTFSGGTDLTTDVVISTFELGGLTTYDKVRFITNPAVYSWAYNGNDFVYTNFSVSPLYTYSGEFSNGSDNTAGQISFELSQTSTGDIWMLYDDPTDVNYSSFQAWVTAINTSATNLDFSASILGTDFTIHSPQDSFEYFNDDYSLFLSYNYASPQWVDNTYGQLYNIVNGVDPTLEPYEGIFQAGVLGDFINTNPCTPTTVTQTCLSNSQISKIITHIDKLVK